MELIIKPTSKCNMCCKFCAASEIKAKSCDRLPEQIKAVIDTLNPQSIIVTGGESLCVEPEYYLELLKLYPDVKLDLVTNLKDFYLFPDKWIEVFKHPNVLVCTSFNYGDTRMWDYKTVYSEEMFRKVVALFKEKVGYVPMFIAVIDENNFHTVMDTVRLAKELGTKCRINNAMKLGRQDKYFPRYNAFKAWLEIIDNGYEEYEINCIERSLGKCPINSNHLCESTIRSVYLEEDGKLRYNSCEDNLNCGKSIKLENVAPELIESKIDVMETINPEKCGYCELFNICNGCSTNREQAKLYSPEYCEEMLKLKDRIIEAGWKL